VAEPVLELRVHGVSGTPPTELLDTPLVDQVAGDHKAGFYRPRLSAERHDPRDGLTGPTPEQRPVLEGYAWGGLTSGAPTRALWLLLLPFTLTNVAPRMRPPGGPSGLVALLWFTARCLALSMTALLVLATCGVTLDLFAWQCGQDGLCAGTGDGTGDGAAPAWVRWLVELPVERRLGLGALAAVAVLLGMWKISGRTVNQYEDVTSHGLVPDDATTDPDELEPSLQSPWMWRNQAQVRRLSMLHLQTGLVAVLLVLLGGLGAAEGWRWALGVAFAVYAMWLFGSRTFTGRRPHQGLRVLQWSLTAVLGIALLALVVRALVGPADRSPVGGLPGYSGTLLVLFSAQLVFLVAFGLVVVVQAALAPKTGRARRSLHDKTAILFAILAVFFGAIFSSGLYVYVGTYLSAGQIRPGPAAIKDFSLAFDVPQIVRDANIAFALSTAVLGGLVLLTLAWLLARTVLPLWPAKVHPEALAASYPDIELSEPAGRARTVNRAITLARLVDVANLVVLVVVASGAALSAALIYLLANASGGPAPLWHAAVVWHERRSPDGCTHLCGFASSYSLQATGATLTVLTLLLLVGLGAAAFRVERTRRSVGILWDLASFWPRAAHPFGSPCYAERGVPDLMTRIHRHQEQGRPVLLAAHSQGTILSLAVLEQLRGRQAGPSPGSRSLALLTFGCVIRRLYCRFFPAYFSPQVVDARAADLRKGARYGWVNVWRHTDYLGGQVVHDSPSNPAATNSVLEVLSPDPVWDRRPGDTQFPSPGRHSNVQRAPEYVGAVQYLQRSLLEPDAPDEPVVPVELLAPGTTG
jgi:hypothetical protein